MYPHGAPTHAITRLHNYKDPLLLFKAPYIQRLLYVPLSSDFAQI